MHLSRPGVIYSTVIVVYSSGMYQGFLFFTLDIVAVLILSLIKSVFFFTQEVLASAMVANSVSYRFDLLGFHFNRCGCTFK